MVPGKLDIHMQKKKGDPNFTSYTETNSKQTYN